MFSCSFTNTKIKYYIGTDRLYGEAELCHSFIFQIKKSLAQLVFTLRVKSIKLLCFPKISVFCSVALQLTLFSVILRSICIVLKKSYILKVLLIFRFYKYASSLLKAVVYLHPLVNRLWGLVSLSLS